MDPISFAALSAFVVKITSVIKAIGKDWNAVVTQAVTWVAGILVMVAAAHSSAFESIALGGHTLDSLNAGALTLAGLGFSSIGSFAFDFKKALDGSDSANETRLLS